MKQSQTRGVGVISQITVQYMHIHMQGLGQDNGGPHLRGLTSCTATGDMQPS